MIIDTHAHIYGEEFSADLHSVIERALDVGVEKIFLPSTDEKSAHQVVELSQIYSGCCYPMLGLHPEDLQNDYTDILLRMEKMLLVENNPYIAIGEVGLDYYWDDTKKEEQRTAFKTQVEWSIKFGLPLMIHARAAHRDIVDTLLPYKDNLCGGVFHCFTGTEEEAEELLTFPNFCLGIGGVVTFKKSTLRDVLASAVPLERIVLETDSPYMAPVPNRGKRNEPSFIPFVISTLVNIYGKSSDEIEKITTNNVKRIFKKI
ncbi:MAG: TatD family hydrolase [Prevotellaceae bacterium]|nr:TatD family hydrolase [Candidatus Faecinaster equi]